MSLLPTGTRVRLTLAYIGDRTETVTGTVTGTNRRGNCNIVMTDSGDGEVVVMAEDVEVLADGHEAQEGDSGQGG